MCMKKYSILLSLFILISIFYIACQTSVLKIEEENVSSSTENKIETRNLDFEYLLPPEYDYISDFSKNYALLVKDDIESLINNDNVYSKIESVRPENNQVAEEQAISAIRNNVEDELRRQEELIYDALGTWTLSDFYTPRGGPPSKDKAEDYLNQEITLSLSDDGIYLFYNEKEYKLEYMRPVSWRYLNDIYQQVSSAADIIFNNTAYELVFIGKEGTVIVFLNDAGDVFFHIAGDVAYHSIFKLSNKSMYDEIVESSYFEEKLEYLMNNCLIHYSYENIVLLREGRFINGEEYEMLSLSEDCTLNVNGEIIELHVGRSVLELVKIEEINSIGFPYSCWWRCDEDEYALMYTFKGENSVIQIMETSKNNFFIKLWANETEEGNIYGYTK